MVMDMKKLLASVLCIVYVLAALTACDNDNSETTTNISDTDMFGISVSSTEEESELIAFADKISSAFQKEDIKALNELIASDSLTWVSLYGGAAYVETSAVKNKGELFFSNGKLMQKSPEVVPPEVDLDIKSQIFGKSSAEFRTADEKEGFLEYIDWSKADSDYMQAHFHAFYNELAWIVDRPVNENGWVVYKLCNNTYIYTNGIGWYEETFSSRVFAGKLFVIKRNGGNLGIVAYIDAK